MKNQWFKKEENRVLLIILIFGLALWTVPLFINSSYIINVIILALFWSFMGSAWNILGGYAGQTSLGHIAYFGLGAYTSLLLQIHLGLSPWIGMAAGFIVGGIFGALVALLTLRYGLKGDYFALFTVAFSQLLKIIFTNFKPVGAAIGLQVPVSPVSLWNFSFIEKKSYYYIIVVMLVLVLLLVNKIHNSKTGKCFIALRENEAAAEAIGVNVFHYKLLASVLSAALTGLGATFYVQYVGYITPANVFNTQTSLDFVILTYVGGRGTIFGPVIGAVLLRPLQEISRVNFSNISGLHLVIYGALLVITIMFLPDGLYGLFHSIRKKRKEKQKNRKG